MRLDARPERLDGARRERPAHRVAEPRVVRRIAEEHRLPVAAGLEARRRETAACAVRGRSPARPEVALEPLAPEPRVAEDRGHVGVAREDPEPMGRAVDRILGAEARVERIRIGEERGVGRTEEGRAVDPLSVAGSFVDPVRLDRGLPEAVGTVVLVMPGAEGNPSASAADGRSTRRTRCRDAGLLAAPLDPAGRGFHRESATFPPRGGFAVAGRWNPERIPGHDAGRVTAFCARDAPSGAPQARVGPSERSRRASRSTGHRPRRGAAGAALAPGPSCHDAGHHGVPSADAPNGRVSETRWRLGSAAGQRPC